MSPASEFVPPPWQSPQGTFRQLIEPPDVEPLSLTEAKLRAGFDWAEGDPREPLLLDFIKAARAQVERDTGLALLSQTWRLDINAWATPGVIPLPEQATPVQSITGVDFDAPLRWYQSGGSIVFYEGPIPPFSIEIVSGWPSVSALKLEAPLLVQAVGLLVAHMATVGRDLATVGTIVTPTPMGYEAAIAPHRLIWLT